MADLVGAGLAVLLVGWTALGPDGDAGPTVGLVAAVVLVLVTARMIGTLHRALPALALVVVAGGVALGFRAELFDGLPLGGPFGYRNATGAFLAQAALASVLVAVAVRRPVVVALGLAAAGAFAFVAVWSSAAAGASLVCAAAVVGIAVAGPRWARGAVVIAACLFAFVLGATAYLGASFTDDESGGLHGRVVSALTERRVVLWHDAIEILVEHPAGVGPGRFDEVSPTALGDQDARWAHNEFLQQGAELGWIGLGLLVALFLWGFARPWLHPAPDAVIAIGAAALAALGIHASVDYVLHFLPVPLAAAAVLGAAQAATHRRWERDDDGPREEGLEGDRRAARLAGPPTRR